MLGNRVRQDRYAIAAGPSPVEEARDTPGVRGRLAPFAPRHTARGCATETGLAKLQVMMTGYRLR